MNLFMYLPSFFFFTSLVYTIHGIFARQMNTNSSQILQIRRYWMIPKYEEYNNNLNIVKKITKHSPPHLHNALEIVYITEGSLEYGVADELYHMDKGDIAFAFPEVIHHCQKLDSGRGHAIFVQALPAITGQFQEQLQLLCPKNPILKADKVHPDIPNALMGLLKNQTRTKIIEQAYIQIILDHAMPHMTLVEKNTIGNNDNVYRTVCHIAKHFQEDLTLETLAKEVGVSKYVLSRVFSKTFHTNFNKYLNEQRLNYAVQQLENTGCSITDIFLDAGFQSHRTFNRVFQEKYHMSPKEYRSLFFDKAVSPACDDNQTE